MGERLGERAGEDGVKRGAEPREPVSAAGTGGGPTPCAVSRWSERLQGPWIPLAVCAGVSVALAATLNVWTDESYSLATSSQTLGETLHRALHFELQPPGYFLLLNLWRRVGGSLLFARLLSVLCVLGALAVVGRLVRRHIPTLPPVAVLAPLAAHPFVLYQAAEVRCYGLALLLSALHCGLLADLYLAPSRTSPPPAPPSPWRARVGEATAPGALWPYALHVVVAVAALYTQYYLGFLLAAGAVVLLAGRRWRALCAYVLVMIVAGLLFIPGFMAVHAQLEAHTDGLLPQRGLTAVRWVYWRLGDYLVPLLGDAGASARPWILRLAILAALGLAVWARRRLARPPLPALAVGVGALLVAHLLLLHLVSPEVVQQRHTVFLFLPLQVAVLAAVATLGGRRVVLGVALALTLLNVAGSVARFSPLAKTGDWRRVAAHLRAHAEPTEPVLVFVPDGVHSLVWHYRGPNRLVPVPGPVNLRRWEPEARIFRGWGPLLGALSCVAAPDGTFWMVDDGTERDLGVVYQRPRLSAFLSACCAEEQRVELYGAIVTQQRLLRRPVP